MAGNSSMQNCLGPILKPDAYKFRKRIYVLSQRALKFNF